MPNVSVRAAPQRFRHHALYRHLALHHPSGTGVTDYPTMVMLSKGHVHPYKGLLQLADLVVFARGGYKETPGEPVPPWGLRAKLAGLVGL